MARIRSRTPGALLVMGTLAILPLFAGCDSTTGPRFPDPIEEEEDSTIEEGMRGSWSLAPVPTTSTRPPARHAMPFTFPVRETT